MDGGFPDFSLKDLCSPLKKNKLKTANYACAKYIPITLQNAVF